MLNSIIGKKTVYIVTGYTDMRKGIDGLAEIVQGKLSLDPYSKALFLFCGKNPRKLKGLLWEGDGFLLLGCPTTMVTAQRESTREYFLKGPHIDCEYNNIHYHLNIVGCFVYPQGYAAVTEYLHNMTGVNMVVDIGNGTANILQINNKKPIEEKCVTEKLGVNQYMIAVQKAVMAAYGKKIDSEVVELFIRKGETDAPDNYKNIFCEEAEKYCRKIFDALYRCEYDPDFMKLYVCGGGVQLIRHFGKYNSDKVIFIDDICATAKGYQQFALKSLKAMEKRSE